MGAVAQAETALHEIGQAANAVVGLDEATVGVGEALLDVREAALNIPEAAVGVGEALLNVPEATLNVSKATLNVSKALLNVPEAPVGVGEALLNVREAALNVPEALLNVPEATLHVGKAAVDLGEATLHVFAEFVHALEHLHLHLRQAADKLLRFGGHVHDLLQVAGELRLLMEQEPDGPFHAGLIHGHEVIIGVSGRPSRTPHWAWLGTPLRPAPPLWPEAPQRLGKTEAY